MPILDYNDAEVNPDIRRIRPDELVLEEKVGGSILEGREGRREHRGNWNGGIVSGHLGTDEIVVKIFGRSPGFNRVEINVLYELQGGAPVPTLLGYLEPCSLTVQTNPDSPIAIEGASVMKRAPGKPLMSIEAYTQPYQTRAYHTRTRINLHAEVARQIAAYHRGCLAQGYIDVDVPERDVFVDIKGKEVRVTKIDQDQVNNRRDATVFPDHPFETYPHKYEHAIHYLFMFNPEMDQWGRGMWMDANADEKALQLSMQYHQRGLSLLPNLLRAFAEHEFDTDTFHTNRKFPDDITFLNFLDRWEKAMEEYGRWIIESPHTP